MTGRDNKLWIALESVGIRQVLARSEAAAVYMADAYARVRGRPTFVYGAYGPGAANVAGSMAEPFWSGSPVVALTSAMRRMDRFRREYQELDQPALFASVTKWGVEASVQSHIPKLVREAARHALSGPPGPVYLGIPSDLFEAEIPDYREPATLDQPIELPLARPAPTDADADAVVRALMSAHRPIILAGNGIHQSGAYEALRKVAERLGIPVATSSAGKGSISETHELALGSVGRYSRNYANAALRDADVVLAIGTQLGGLVTDSYRLISQDAQLIHVNVDPEVIGLNFPTQLGLVADARTFLEAVLAASDRSGAHQTVASFAHVENLAQERARLARTPGRAGRPGRQRRPSDASRGRDGRGRSADGQRCRARRRYRLRRGVGRCARRGPGRRAALPPRGRVTGLGLPGLARGTDGRAPSGRSSASPEMAGSATTSARSRPRSASSCRSS